MRGLRCDETELFRAASLDEDGHLQIVDVRESAGAQCDSPAQVQKTALHFVCSRVAEHLFTANPVIEMAAMMPIAEIPYLRSFPNDGRIRPLLHYYDHVAREWSVYNLVSNDQVFRFVPANLVTGFYLSTSPADPSDIQVPIFTFIFQRFPTRETYRQLEKAFSDVENAVCLIEKQRILHDYCRRNDSQCCAEILRTEIEYALVNHRSFYDLLHGVLIAFVKRHMVGAKEMPDSFRVMCQKSEQDLITKYRIPAAMAKFYKRREKEFMALRDVRDDLTHHGVTPDAMVYFDNGFGILSGTPFAARLKSAGIWEKLKPRENDIGSFLALLAHLAVDMIAVQEEFTKAFADSFAQLPAETAPGYTVFTRVRFGHYNRLQRIVDDPWDRAFYPTA